MDDANFREYGGALLRVKLRKGKKGLVGDGISSSNYEEYKRNMKNMQIKKPVNLLDK